MIDEESSAESHTQSPDRSPVVLSLILISYNSSRVLPGFISSLREYPPSGSFELVVVDNASEDQSVTLLRENFPDAIVIQNDHNMGFARGVNQAADKARGEFLLLVNPDVSWENDVIDRLISFLAAKPNAAAVTPRMLNPDGTAQMCLRRFPTHSNIWFSRGGPGLGGLARVFQWYPYTVPDPPSASTVEAVAAAFFLMRRAAFDAIGGMDDRYFLYVEDTDLCRRFVDEGWENWIDPSVWITHSWGRRGSQYRRLKTRHRDSIRLYFRKFHPNKRVRNAVLFFALWLSEMFARLTDGGQGSHHA